MKADEKGLEALSGRAAADNPPRRLSTVFEELARSAEGPITVAQFRRALGDRSFATLLVFFSCLNLLPLPPGSTLVLGIPLLLLSVQMVFGRRAVWMPEFILRKSVAADSFRRFTERFMPRLKWAERFIRPRYWPFARSHADRIIGSIALILSIAVTLPVPLGNWLPAFSCALVGLALSERDGVLLSIAVVSGALSLAVIAVVVGAASILAGMLIH